MLLPVPAANQERQLHPDHPDVVPADLTRQIALSGTVDVIKSSAHRWQSQSLSRPNRQAAGSYIYTSPALCVNVRSCRDGRVVDCNSLGRGDRSMSGRPVMYRLKPSHHWHRVVRLDEPWP
jgi:hypothetical protein